MIKNLGKKWLVGSVFGVIFLSLLSNIIWAIIEPLFENFLVYFLRFTTFGITKISDGIYKEIAKGLHEKVSIEIFTMISPFFIVFIVFTATLIYKVHKKITNPESSLGSSKIVLTDLFKSKIYILLNFIVLTLFSLIVFINSIQVIYINKVVTYYNQMITIISPSITAEDNEKFNSDFSQIQSKDDYVRIIESIQKVARNNNYITPKPPSVF